MSETNKINPVSKIAWLVRRELWEHKGMLLWTPAALGALMTALTLLMALAGRHFSYDYQGHQGSLGDVVVTLGDSQKAQLAQALSSNYGLAAGPIFFMLGFTVFFYCLGALHDERRDRSLLFWKSLPVSDRLTVLSKLAVALLVAPLIALATGTLASLAMLVITCVFMLTRGVNLFGAVAATPDFYLAPLRLFSLLPVYFLWALPTVGWLLMVSAWARSKVFLWAVGSPLLGCGMLVWMNRMAGLDWNAGWLFQHVAARLLFGSAPGSWFVFDAGLLDIARVMHGDNPSLLVVASWASLGHAPVWLGAAAGGAMLYAATELRRWRDDH